jgi:hypothetical protein
MQQHQAYLDARNKVIKCDLCPRPAILFIFACTAECRYCEVHKPKARKPDDTIEQERR